MTQGRKRGFNAEARRNAERWEVLTQSAQRREGNGFVDCDSGLISSGWFGLAPLDSRFRGNDGVESGSDGEESANGGAMIVYSPPNVNAF